MKWEFSDTSQLIGLHGRVFGGTIAELGFITFNTDDCPIEEVATTSAGKTEEMGPSRMTEETEPGQREEGELPEFEDMLEPAEKKP